MPANERSRSVVIVAFGAAQLLQQTLDALDPREHVYVIDNSSDDAIRELAAAAGASYDAPGANLGFARAVNRGLAVIAAERPRDDVVLLNPDAVIGSAALDELHATFARPGNEGVAAVTPRLRGLNSDEQRAIWPFPSPSAMWREAFRLSDRRQQDGFAVGAVLLLRREALDQIGGFDERYFLYAEEADWQRSAANEGWHSVVAEVHAEHVGAATSESNERREQLFHAGQETYIRKWFGAGGWCSYRFAALVGALMRVVAGDSLTRHAARQRVGLYVHGPRRVAGVSRPRRVTHLVVTGNAAGTERYVAQLAGCQVANGWDVTVVGGDSQFMRSQLPAAVRWVPGESVWSAARALLTLGRCDVVHSHLTTADLLAVASRPWHGGRVISTRHIAKARGNRAPVRMLARVLQRGISVEISISQYVADAIGVPSVVVRNGVPNREQMHRNGSRRVIVAQRLEPEKETLIGLEAWKLSNLHVLGWSLSIFGEGSEGDKLRQYCKLQEIEGVEWHGWTPSMDVEMTTAAALLATAPREPLGLSVLEAMSIGLPAVVAKGGGHLETAARVSPELAFSPGDAADCARVLGLVARGETPSAHVLQSWQREHHSLKAVAQRVTALYVGATAIKRDR